MKHLLVDITAHGFGHLAQTAAVLNALDYPDLTITLRSLAPESILRDRIQHDFHLIPYQQDNGMVMQDALNVDPLKSFQWHQQFHQNYEQKLTQAIQELNQLKPDVLFTDIPYLSLDAAHALAIPSIALCSLNWADVFQTYCGQFAGAEKIHNQIIQAYQKATVFLQPTPSMPMPLLHNTQTIEPLTAQGKAQPDVLRQRLELNTRHKLILVSLGGIGIDYPLNTWPQLDNVVWIFPDEVLTQQREDWKPQSQAQMNYLDLLASCDLILTKTGYGTQTEAVINQVPALCIDRGDWPEQPYLRPWHEQQGEVIYIEWSQILQGKWADTIHHLLAQPWTKPRPSHQGAQQAAAYIKKYLAQAN
ncbi:MAG: hypothetical protein WAQ53_00965 [Thiofilum sp.]|uniref:hypothetical protein n=1 Tax=Thiofilum sp. TaxID=2212733 RepID=UPI0025F838CE|nr:hypothetical protein [Thiofilum sp.]MBK8455548.1 hypothetical protein [Thiofilum sp.]